MPKELFQVIGIAFAAFALVASVALALSPSSPEVILLEAICKPRENVFMEYPAEARLLNGQFGEVDSYTYRDLNGFDQVIDKNNASQWICMLK